MQAAITDDPQKPWRAGWQLPLAYQVVLTLAAAVMVVPSDRAYAAYVNPPYVWRINPSDAGTSEAASDHALKNPAGSAHRRRQLTSSVGGKPVKSNGQSIIDRPDRSRTLSSLASYIDKGRYYWLDQVRYYYLDAGQYNLLGVEIYFWRQYCYPIWYGFPQRGGSCGFAVNPFVDSFCPIWTDQPETGDLRAWPTYCSPGDYIDRGLYYSLDQRQYYYLEEGQYNLLGGFGYLLGHPCSVMWYDYHPYLWGIILEKAISPPEKALPEWVDFYGDFTILGEPAQVGDVLQAFVSADGTKRIRVGQSTATVQGQYGDLRVLRDDHLTSHKDAARPADMVTFGAWDKSAARWYPVEITRGLAKWTAHGVCPDLIGVNAVPEVSTIAFLALGALMIRRYDKWQTRSRRASLVARVTGHG